VLSECKMFVYHSQKAKSKKAQTLLKELVAHKGLSVLVVAYEATITPTFKVWFKKFLTTRKAMMVLDESHRIKSSTSKVKTSLVAMGTYAEYRRILTGSPVEKPPDIYSQLRFLDQNFWKKKGFPTKAEIDAYFCITEDRQFGRNKFKHVVGYRNIDHLAQMVAETGYSMTLEDAGIKLPPILLSKRYHKLTSLQEKAYTELSEECKTILTSGDIVETDVAMTTLLRLQQIICGYVACEAEQPVQQIDPDGKNPRLDLTLEIVEETNHQIIIWCRFTEDVRLLCNALGKQAVRYDGQVDNDDRARAKAQFQRGEAKVIVMTEAGAEGHTLVGAKTTIFHSNNFRQIQRTQKLARNYRIGQKDPVHVIDIVCEGTVDERIIQALRDKKELADLITGNKNGLKDFI
jgi:SNF2 family DNA or RNA helicase